MPEHSPLHRPFKRLVVRRRERYRHYRSGISRVDDPVIPQPGCSKIGIRLRLDLSFQSQSGSGELRFVNWQPLFCQRLPFDYVHHSGKLLRPHHRDPMIWPGEQKPRLVGSPAHRVVPRAIRTPSHYRDRRHRRVRHLSLIHI